MVIMTPAEQAHVRAYDALTIRQTEEQKEYAERPFQVRYIRAEMKAWDEAEALDTIQFLSKDIGVMRKIMEWLPGNDEVQEYCKYLILCEQQQLLDLMEEMQ